MRIRRSSWFISVGVVLVAGVLVTARMTSDDDMPTPGGPAPRAAEAVPYAPESLFKRAVPARPPLDPRSDAIAARLAENARTALVSLSHRSDVPPIFRVHSDDPLYEVRAGIDGLRFRARPDVVVGGGSDRPLVLLDREHPDHGPFTELRLYRANIDHDHRVIEARGGGLLHYNNDGRRLNPDGSRSVGIPFAGVGTGSGLSILAGVIRPEEVRAGEIRHAIRIAYSAPDFTNRFRAPAITTDQPKRTRTRDPASALDMGTRLQLDPEVDCDRRVVPGRDDASRETRFLRILCRAMQRYGLVVLDGTAPNGIVLYMEDAATAEWEPIVGEERSGSYGWLVRGDASGDADVGIPWHRFRALAADAIPSDEGARVRP